MRFFFVAGTSGQLAKLRTTVTAYAEDEKDWQPFMPDLPEPVWGSVYLTAVEQRVMPAWEGIAQLSAEEFIRRLREAEDRNEVVVIIVDPWSIQLPGYGDLLKLYDKERYDNCVVLIPWNAKDVESTRDRSRLQQIVREVLRRNSRYGESDFYIESIESLQQLRQRVGEVINKVRSRLMEHSVTLNRAVGSQPIAKPTLSGPAKE